MKVCKTIACDGAFYKNGVDTYLEDSTLRLKTLTYLVSTKALKIEDLHLDDTEVALITGAVTSLELLCKSNKINKAAYISKMFAEQYELATDTLNCDKFGLDEMCAVNLDVCDALIFSDAVDSAEGFYRITNKTKCLYKELLNVIATKAIYNIDDFSQYVETSLSDSADLRRTMEPLVIRSLLLSSGSTYDQVIRNVVLQTLN